MALRTRGTVQLDSGTKGSPTPDWTARISPTSSHTVTVDKRSFIVFVETPLSSSPPVSSPGPLASSLREPDTRFTVSSVVLPALIAAAAGSVCVDLDINDASSSELIRIIFPSSGV